MLKPKEYMDVYEIDNSSEGIMKFSIPHPCDIFDLGLFEKYEKVSEVYVKGDSSNIGTGRIFQYSPSKSYLKKLCKEIHDRGCEVNIVLNATCFGGEQYTKKWITNTLRYLDHLSSLNVDLLTIADPYLIALIHHYGYSFKIVVSVLAFVHTVVGARYFDEMKVDRITLSTNINRDLNLIRKIRKCVKSDLALIVNEGCLLDCPNRHFCYNYISHLSGNKDSDIHADYEVYYWVSDNLIRIKQPYTLLTSPWIRPENLRDYENVGINIFKISGRNKPLEFLKKALEAYHSLHFDGNIFDIIDGGCRMPDAWSKNPTGYRLYGPPRYYLDNKNLDAFFKKVTSCDKNCSECGFCKEFAEKHLRENEEIPKPLRKIGPHYYWMPRKSKRSLFRF